MNKKRLLWLIPLVLLLAVLIWAGVFYFLLRGRSLNHRPLVLISSPLNGEYVELGRGVAVHAVARAEKGVRRMQVWVDDALVAEKDVSDEDVNSPMVIVTNWVPSAAGRHVVSVRAISANGVSGQSTVFVTAEETAAARHVVEEGETFKDIAASYGVEEEAIIEANGAAAGENPQAGDELEIPAAGGGSSPPFDAWGEEVEQANGGGIGPDEGADAADGAPSVPAPAPGSLEALNMLMFAQLFQSPTDPVQLVVEVSALQTRESYESLHCYVSLAGSTPTWVPDADNDQLTDETFESRAGGSEWNVARYLSEMNATHITWERHTPVPLDISCVGITEGGRNAVELGRILDDVEPHEWGVPQTARSSGGESQFNLAYLVTYPSKGLDETMTPPWDVRLHVGDSTLSWSYLPDVDGAPVVDGFAILLNDQLQFVTDGRAREVDIPPQWFEVACNTVREFTVVAFKDSYPDGDYSNPSEPAVLPGGEPGSEECPLSVTITFQVLNIGNLGNQMPVTAFFIANEQRLTLDGFNGVIVPEVDTYGIPRPEVWVIETTTPPTLGLEENHGYMIGSLFEATTSSFHQLVVELPYDDPENPYDSLQTGFEIYGPDHRLLCGGDLAVSAEDARAGINGTINNEYPVEDDPSLCVVTYALLPVQSRTSNDPLPNIDVESITYNNEYGLHVLHLRNTGQADWVNQDLVIEATTPEGDLIGRYTFRNSTLEAGQRVELMDRQFDWEPVMGACVELDPDNNVQEVIDRVIENGVISSRGRFCPSPPDLRISSVQPLASPVGIRVVIENRGQAVAGDLESGTLQPVDLPVIIYTPDREYSPLVSHTFENISIGAYDSITLDIETDDEILGLQEYIVHLNPERTIAESFYDNNTYEVNGVNRLFIDWELIDYQFCETGLYDLFGRNSWVFHLDAAIIGGDYQTPIASWSVPQEDLDYFEDTIIWVDRNQDYQTDDFTLNGDETLSIHLSADLHISAQPDYEAEEVTFTLSPEEIQDGTILLNGEMPSDCMRADIMNSSFIDLCRPYLSPGYYHFREMQVHADRIWGDCYWSTVVRVYRRDQ